MSTPANEKSGKLLMFAVILLGVIAAVTSWWFRYAATHRAAAFWGRQAAELIRDAPHVTLRTNNPAVEGTNPADLPRDISSAPGLSHLRAELIQDHSYDWTADGPANLDWSSSLVFEVAEGAEPRAVVLFSRDFRWAANGSAGDPAANAVAIVPFFAKGLQTFFDEQASAAPAER